MRLTVGDIVEFVLGESTAAAYVIGESIDSTDERQIVVVATSRYLGIPLQAAWCKIIAAGYLRIALPLQGRCMVVFPGTLHGLFLASVV